MKVQGCIDIYTYRILYIIILQMSAKIGTNRLKWFGITKMNNHFRLGLQVAERLETGIVVWIRDLPEREYQQIQEGRESDGLYRNQGSTIFLSEIVQLLDLQNCVFNQPQYKKMYWRRVKVLDKMRTVIVVHKNEMMAAGTRYYKGKNNGGSLPYLPLTTRAGEYTRMITYVWIESPRWLWLDTADSPYEDITEEVMEHYGLTYNVLE